MTDTNEHAFHLSQDGARRRDAMLDALRADVRRYARRRKTLRAVRTGATVGLLVAGFAALALAFDPARDSPGITIVQNPDRTTAPQIQPITDPRVVSTERGIAGRFTVASSPGIALRAKASSTGSRVRIVDDAGLAQALREAGYSVGVVRVAGSVDVTDRPWEQAESKPDDQQG